MAPLIPSGSRITNLKEMANSIATRAGAAWDAINGRAFGPGVPLQPVFDSLTGQADQAPRQWQYQPSINTITQPRSENPSLTPFEQLRNLASLYDVARICVSAREEEFQGLQWSIKAKVSKEQQARQTDCDEVTSFWKYPDRKNDFTSWQNMLLEDLFVLDAPAIYKQRDLGSRLHSLDIIDGSTIKPVLDVRGRTAGYQQILYGFPHGQYSRDSIGGKENESLLPNFSPSEIIYRPRWTRSFTPYGFPPSEWVILRVNTALRKQSFDLRYFTDGNIPDVWVQPADDKQNLNPQQVAAFEEAFNAVLAGNDANRRKAKFLPWKSDVKEMRPFSYDTKLDEWMMKITCAAYGVTPAELGFTADVNRATADSQENITYRRGVKPLALWLKTMYDQIIQEDMGYPDLEWHWMFGETEDKNAEANTDSIYLGAGVISADEVRSMRFGGQLEGPSPATLAAEQAEQYAEEQAGQEEEVDDETDDQVDQEDTEADEEEETEKVDATGDIAKGVVQQPGVGRGHGRHHTGPRGPNKNKRATTTQRKGQVMSWGNVNGKKMVRQYGQKNIPNSSSAPGKKTPWGSDFKQKPVKSKPAVALKKPAASKASNGAKYGKVADSIQAAFQDIHKLLD